MKKLCILAVLLFVACSFLSAAGNLEFKGFLQPQLKVKINDPFAFNDQRDDLFRLEIVSTLGDKSAFKVVPDILTKVQNNLISYEYDLREAYVDLYSKICDVRIGKQLVSWGASKENNAVDVINPSDFRDPSRKKIDRKIGLLAVKGSFYLPADITLDTVLVPFAGRTIFPEVNTQWSQGNTAILDNTLTPDAKLSNSEIGLRLSKNISGTDIALTYFNGWEDMPSYSSGDLSAQLALLYDNPTTEVSMAKFRRTQMIGLDFDGGIGKLGINTELAMFLTEDTERDDPYLKNPYLQWIIGLEYDLPLGIIAGLQYSQEFKSGADDAVPDSLTLVSGLGMDLGFFTSQAVGCGLEKKFGQGDVHSFNLFGFLSIDTENQGYMIAPNLKLSQSDAVSVSMGVNIFGGTAGSILSGYSSNSDVYVSVKYSF